MTHSENLRLFQPYCELHCPSLAQTRRVRLDGQFPSLQEGSFGEADLVMRVERVRLSDGDDGAGQAV